MSLSELLLSSTAASSPLPTTQLHSLLNGSLVFSFKSPNASTSTATEQDQLSSLGHRKTMGVVESADGCGGVVMGLGGKEGRAGINVWGFQKEQVLQRLIPPVRLSTICLSNTGMYLAGGTSDGRIFFWEVSSGTLLLTIDAHYRPVSVLEFSHDDAALVSGGEDAGVSVWNVGRMLNATPMDPPTPFATLTDHTLPITAVAIGLGTFPCCRILTASLDATCKIWDLSTSAPALLSTFAFPSPVTHLAWDSLERFFFVASPISPAPVADATGKVDTTPGGSKIMQVALYKKRKDEFGHEMIEAIGGGGRGEVERVAESNAYTVSDTITALHLSVHSPTLILGTSSSTIHVLSLPTLLPTRIIPPPLSSTPPGPITFLSTLIRPPDLGAGTAEGGGVALPARTVMSGGMSRSVKGVEWSAGGKDGRVVAMRIGKAVDVRGLIGIVGAEEKVEGMYGIGNGRGSKEAGEAQVRCMALEEEVLKLRQQLGKAVGLNEAMWKKVVEGSLKASDGQDLKMHN